MPQIKLVVCRQVYVVCWSDLLVKNDGMSVYFLFKSFFRCVSRPVKTKTSSFFVNPVNRTFIGIAIRAKRLWIPTKTACQQPTFTFGKCKDMSLGTLSKMTFQLFIEARIYSQPEKMRPTGPLP